MDFLFQYRSMRFFNCGVDMLCKVLKVDADMHQYSSVVCMKKVLFLLLGDETTQTMRVWILEGLPVQEDSMHVWWGVLRSVDSLGGDRRSHFFNMLTFYFASRLVVHITVTIKLNSELSLDSTIWLFCPTWLVSDDHVDDNHHSGSAGHQR